MAQRADHHKASVRITQVLLLISRIQQYLKRYIYPNFFRRIRAYEAT